MDRTLSPAPVRTDRTPSTPLAPSAHDAGRGARALRQQLPGRGFAEQAALLTPAHKPGERGAEEDRSVYDTLVGQHVGAGTSEQAASDPGTAARALAARRQVQSVARDIMILLRTYDDVAPHVEVVSNGVRGVLAFAESQPTFLYHRASQQSTLSHSGGGPEIDWMTHLETLHATVAHVAEAKRLQAAYRANPTSANAMAFARSMGALVSGFGDSLADAPFPLSLYAKVLSGCDGAFFAAVSANLLHSVRAIEQIDANTRETGRATERGRMRRPEPRRP